MAGYAKAWSDDEEMVLSTSYATHGAKACQALLPGRSLQSIIQRAFKHGYSSSQNPAKHRHIWPRYDTAMNRAADSWRYTVEPVQNLTWRLAA